MAGAPQYPIEGINLDAIYTFVYDTYGYESVDSIENPILSFMKSQEVEVLEKNLGEKSNLYKVRALNAPNIGVECFVRSSFLLKKGSTSSETTEVETPDKGTETIEQLVLNATPEQYVIEDKRAFNKPLVNIKIKDAELNVPYKENGRYNIVVDTGMLSKTAIQENITSDEITNVKYKAFVAMLKYYGKDLSTVSDEKLLSLTNSSYNYVEHSDPYFSARPGQNAKIKVMIQEKYFQIFKDTTFEKFSSENIHKNFISCNIKVNELDKTVRDLVKVLEKYHRDISKFSGEIDGLNLKDLSNNLRKFLSEFKKYLSQNKVIVDFNDSNNLELGFNKESYRLEYVLYYNPYGRFLRIGMDKFCSIFNVKISKLLINYRNIITASVSGMGWMDFVKEYFAGEFKIKFTKPTQLAGNAKKAMSNLKDELNNLKAEFEELSLMTPKDISNISRLKKDGKFMESSSNLLLRSMDTVGDNFLINLPDILANVEDLQTLYTLVFDKVSVKDLLDVMMENVSENLNLPDINEVKIRGILKAIKFEQLIELIPDIVEDSDMIEFLLTVLEAIEINENTMDLFVSCFDYLKFDHIGDRILLYDSGLDGIYSMTYQGDLVQKIEDMGLLDQSKLSNAIKNGFFKFSEIYQQTAVYDSLKDIFEHGIRYGGTYPIPHHVLKIGIFDFLIKSEKKQILNGIDVFFKNKFKDTPDLFGKLSKNKKIKAELGKLNLSKKKLLKKAPGLNVSLETKKIDASFSMPSIKNVNPSFDFSSFQFGKTGDIFGSAMESIEKSIKDGIEGALVNTFKSMLSRTLESVNKDSPDLDSPDYGGLNFNDMFDATNGFSAKMMAKLALSKAKTAIEKFDPNFCEDSRDISGYEPTEEDIMAAFDEMSSAIKPLELTRVLKGQKNKKDYNNIVSAIKDENMRQLFTEDFFNQVVDTATEFVDLKLLKDIEDSYGDKEVLISVCENAGIPYCIRDIKSDLMVKYPDFTDDEICEMIDDMVEEVKDSIVDSIANLKEDFSDNLPFNEDPCSFMPKPTDIDPLNFINDMTFDSIFNPIELEYKSEAVTIPDLFLIPDQSDNFINMFYYSEDRIVDSTEPYTTDAATGVPKVNLVAAGDTDAWTLSTEDRLYNQDFGNHYFGKGTPLYGRAPLTEGGEYYRLGDGNSSEGAEAYNDDWDFKFNSETGEWTCAEGQNIYVRSSDQNLKPIPVLSNFFSDPLIRVRSGISQSDSRNVFVQLGFNGALSENDKFIYRYDGDIDINYSKIDLKNPTIECSQKATETIEQSTDIGIMNLIKNNVDEIHKVGSGIYQGIYNTSTLVGKNFLNEDNFLHIEHQEHIRYEYGNKNNEKTKPVILRVISEFFAQFLRGFGKSELFDTDEMLAFLIDDEDINLFKVQDSKNAAKQDNNDNCTFQDGEKNIETASTKQLLYLTFRIFVIEKIVRNCFMYSLAYPDEASDSFCNTIISNMEDELKLAPNNYYEDVFKSAFEEIHNEKFSTFSSVAKTLIKEIFEDVSKSFDKIFRNSGVSLVKSFLGNVEYDLGKPDISHLTMGLNKMYNRSFEFDDINPEDHVSRFIIQRAVQYKPPGSSGYHEIPYALATESQILNPDNRIILKLCYVFDMIDSGYLEPPDSQEWSEGVNFHGTIPNANGYLLFDAVGGDINVLPFPQTFSGLYHFYKSDDGEKLLDLGNYSSGAGTLRYCMSTSHQINKYQGNRVTNAYYLLPLAVTIQNTEDATRFALNGKGNIITTIMQDSGELSILDFLNNIMKTQEITEYISRVIDSMVILSNPEIINMFLDTKTAIRNAMNSMNKDEDNYAHEERESTNTQLEQSAGVSTSPEFSSKAGKMALMTVPMIVKGMAEMFDPNIKIASAIRAGFSLAGVDIPPPVASLMAAPVNVIPLAPGPPITPLGLLYLGTSFLEPKERKKLSDLKRGKNLNAGAQADGTIGDLDELADSAALETFENAEQTVNDYYELTKIFVEGIKGAYRALSEANGYTEEEKVSEPGTALKHEVQGMLLGYSVEVDYAQFGISGTSVSVKNDVSKLFNIYHSFGDISEALYTEFSAIIGRMKEATPEGGDYNGGNRWDRYTKNKFRLWWGCAQRSYEALTRKVAIDVWVIGKFHDWGGIDLEDRHHILNDGGNPAYRRFSYDLWLDEFYNMEHNGKKLSECNNAEEVLDWADSYFGKLNTADSYGLMQQKVEKGLDYTADAFVTLSGFNHSQGYAYRSSFDIDYGFTSTTHKITDDSLFATKCRELRQQYKAAIDTLGIEDELDGN